MSVCSQGGDTALLFPPVGHSAPGRPPSPNPNPLAIPPGGVCRAPAPCGGLHLSRGGGALWGLFRSGSPFCRAGRATRTRPGLLSPAQRGPDVWYPFVACCLVRRAPQAQAPAGPHLVGHSVRGASCALGLRLGRTAPRAPQGTIPAPSALSCAVLCLASRFVSFAFLPSRPSRVRYLFNPASALCCAPPHRPRPRLLACIVAGPPNQRRGGLLFFNEALRLSGGKPPLTWVPPRRSRLRLWPGRGTVLSVCPAARPAPVPPLAGPWDAVQMRPWPGLVRSFWFSFSALSFFVRSPPGPRLARSWAARGMPPRCGPGPDPLAPSFFAPHSKL